VTRFVDTHREEFGVEPICHALEVAPSSYYAHKHRPPSARAIRDQQLKVEIMRVYNDNFQVYGAEKIWRQLGREGIQTGRDHVARLMRQLGSVGWCAASHGAPPPPPSPGSAPLTWSTACSPRRRPTACGSPT
jgi:putative transposase